MLCKIDFVIISG